MYPLSSSATTDRLSSPLDDEGPAGSVTGFRPHVLKLAPTSFFGDYGCHVRIFEEALGLQNRGASVTICTYHTGRDVSGITIERSIDVPWRRGVQIGASHHKFYLDTLLGLRAGSVALRQRPDLIHGHLHEGAFLGYPLSRAFRVPLVFDCQGSLTSEMIDHNFLRRESRLYRPLRWIERVINDRADVIITSTRHTADLLVRQFGCPARKIVSVPDGVNPDSFAPRWDVDETRKLKLRRALDIPSGRKIVAYLGLLAEYQGLGHLLRAAARILEHRQDVHFLLMGYPGQARYRAFAEELGIGRYVTFTGCVAYEHAPLYLALGDVAVSPKMSETEGNGKLLNYMSVGLPTVTFDTPVSREILDELGVFAKLGDAASLAGALETLLDDDSLANDLGRRLRERVVEHFSWNASISQILDIYRLVLQ